MSPIRTAPTIRCAASSTLIAALNAEPLDRGSNFFDPSNLEFVSIDVGNKTVNLIPGEARARFNIRFNDKHNARQPEALIETRAKKAAGEHNPLPLRVGAVERRCVRDRARPLHRPGVGRHCVGDRQRTPQLSSSGGTSDARFIKDYCPVVEFGLVGQIHARYRRACADRRSRGADRDLTGGFLGPVFSVIHPHQIKPFRRRDRPAGRAVARGERGGKIVARSIWPSPTSASEPTIERT